MFNFTESELLEFHNMISNNVKKYRKEKKITQLDLALELGFNNSSFISHAENKNLQTHHYSVEHLYKISKILDIDIQLIFQR
jgi:transcriptional regulator with XRE-family HTH domain